MTPLPRDVAAVIDAYPAPTRAGVLRLRALIHEVAARTGTGPLNETLKWRQPSIVPANGDGTALRLGPHKRACFALFAHCQTSVIADFATAFPGQDRLDGRRAVLFDTADQIVPERHGLLIHDALRYHARRRAISR